MTIQTYELPTRIRTLCTWLVYVPNKHTVKTPTQTRMAATFCKLVDLLYALIWHLPNRKPAMFNTLLPTCIHANTSILSLYAKTY